MRNRKRIDWEKELQKTEEIRMRGFKTSILSFAVAALFLFGASRMNNDTSVMPSVIMIGCFLTATALLVFTLKRRANKLKKMREKEDDEEENESE